MNNQRNKNDYKTALKLSLIILLISTAINAFSQKRLTIEEAVFPRSHNLVPKNLNQLQWRGNTSYFTYVENNALMQQSATLSKPVTLLSMDDLNTIINKKIDISLSRFPEMQWINFRQFKFVSGNHHIIVNMQSKKADRVLSFNPEGENLDFHQKEPLVAYTIGNNLFYSEENGDESRITTDTAAHVINGQEVHRREFGIHKGTFWSPEANYLAFYRKDESMVTDYPLLNINTRIAGVEHIKYPMAGMESHVVKLGIYNLLTKETIFLKTDDSRYLTNICWSPDEKYVYIAELNRDQNHMWLNQYDVITGQFVKTLFEETHPKYVEPLHPMDFLESDPNRFIWQSRRDGYNHVYLYNKNGTLIRQLSEGKWEVTEVLGFDEKERFLYFQSTIRSPLERHLSRVSLSVGNIETLTAVSGTHETTINTNGSYIIDNYSNIKTPRKIDILDEDGNLVRNLLTAEDPLEDYSIGKIEISTFQGANEDSVYYRLLKPANFNPNGRYPLLLYVYGGPHVQRIHNEWLGGLDLWYHYMSQGGYLVLTIDNHGSANRGLEFENSIFRQLGSIEMEDQVAGLEMIMKRPYVNQNRIGVNGWSYGGFMATSLMVHHPDIFEVGVAGGPVIDWKYYEVMYTERYMDTPQDNAFGYEKSSLINYAGNLDGRLLMIHGAKDPVVVWQQSLIFVEECIKKDKLIDYFVYPNHEHGIGGKDNLHLMKKITQYFVDYL